MGRQVEYRRKSTPVLGITDVLPYSTLQSCYQVLERCKKSILKPSIGSVRAHKPPYRADANVDSTDSTVPRCCGVGVRVSAPLRRGAAPYGDGFLCSQTSSHLNFLSILGDPKWIRPKFYKEFCVRHNGTFVSSVSPC